MDLAVGLVKEFPTPPSVATVSLPMLELPKVLRVSCMDSEKKTYVFRVMVEPDEDRWVSWCPALEQFRAATWGYTEEEALKHIREVVEMVVSELVEDNLPIPAGPPEAVAVYPTEHRVAVPVWRVGRLEQAAYSHCPRNNWRVAT